MSNQYRTDHVQYMTPDGKLFNTREEAEAYWQLMIVQQAKAAEDEVLDGYRAILKQSNLIDGLKDQLIAGELVQD